MRSATILEGEPTHKIMVGRPVDGLTINDALEFLLDDSGAVRLFDSPEEARSFLIAAGVGLEELRHMTFIEIQNI